MTTRRRKVVFRDNDQFGFIQGYDCFILVFQDVLELGMTRFSNMTNNYP